MTTQNTHDFSGRTAKLYDQVKAAAWPNYDAMQRKVGQIFAHELHRIERKNGNRPRAIFNLEIGCGTGETTQYLWIPTQACKNPDYVHLDCIDSETAMIRQAKKKFLFGSPNFQISDAKTWLTQYPTMNPYHIVASAMTIHNLQFAERGELTRIIYDKMEPNGLFINYDKIMPDGADEIKEAIKIELQRLEGVRKIDHDEAEKWIAHYHTDYQPDRILRKNAYIESLYAAGFRDVNVAVHKDNDVIITAKK